MNHSGTREVAVLIGAGAIGQAIARRVATGRTLLLADINQSAANDVATLLTGFGFEARATYVDVSSQSSVDTLAAEAAGLGDITHVIHTAGLSPAQASAEAIVAVDLAGTAFVLKAFGRVIAPGGSGLVVASQAGYMLPPLPAEQNQALANTSADQLTKLPFLDTREMGSGAAYAIAKRANSLRVQAASVEWGDRGARLNSVSPGIIMTPLAQDELNGPGGEGYRRMIASSAAGRVGTPDEVGALGAFLMSSEAAFISGYTDRHPLHTRQVEGGYRTGMRSRAPGDQGANRAAVEIRSRPLRLPFATDFTAWPAVHAPTRSVSGWASARRARRGCPGRRGASGRPP